MLHIATKEQVQEYRDNPGLNQSKLKQLADGLDAYGKELDPTKDFLVTGSAVDMILLGEPGEFEKTFYVSELVDLPSEAIVEMLKRVYQERLQDYSEYLATVNHEVVDPVQFKEDHFEVAQSLEPEQPIEVTPFHIFAGDLTENRTYLLDAASDWNSKWGADAKFNNLTTPACVGYFADICKASGKVVINTAQHDTIKAIVESLRTNNRTKRFFDREVYEGLSHVDMYYQLPIYFEYMGEQCKALIDMAIVEEDMEGNIISVCGIDLKTLAGNTFYFPTSLRSRRYDIQAAWYTLALAQHFKVPSAFEGDIMKPFLFVAESTTYQGKPLTFELDDTLLRIGLDGRRAITLVETNIFANEAGDNATLMKEILGINQLVEMYIYHNNNGFDAERIIKQTPVESPIRINWEGCIEPLLN